MADLLEGRESGEKEGYISIEDLRELLKIIQMEKTIDLTMVISIL